MIWRKFFHSCYLWGIRSHKTALFRKNITVVCMESWISFHKADLWAIPHFTEQSLRIFWYLGLSRLNDNLINVSKTCSFSSCNWNISVSGSYNIYSLKSLRKRRQQLSCQLLIIFWDYTFDFLSAATKPTMQAELCLDSTTTSRGLPTIVESPSFSTTSYGLPFAHFWSLQSATDKWF